MAAPNIIGATTIIGKTTGVKLSSTSPTVVLSNAAGSNKCLKVNTFNIANTGSNVVSVTVSWHNAAAIGGTAFAIAGNVSVPVGATLTVIDKSSQYYLEENSSLGAVADFANSIEITCSYEDIS